MGYKGDKHTNDSQLSTDLLMEKLSSIESITSKKMFGGHGIFHDGKMFGIVDSTGQAYFKTNEATGSKYMEKGSKKHGKMPYHSIPEEIFTNIEDLKEWARESIEISK